MFSLERRLKFKENNQKNESKLHFLFLSAKTRSAICRLQHHEFSLNTGREVVSLVNEREGTANGIIGFSFSFRGM